MMDGQLPSPWARIPPRDTASPSPQPRVTQPRTRSSSHTPRPPFPSQEACPVGAVRPYAAHTSASRLTTCRSHGIASRLSPRDCTPGPKR